MKPARAVNNSETQSFQRVNFLCPEPAFPSLPSSWRPLPSFSPKLALGAAVAPQLAGHMSCQREGTPRRSCAAGGETSALTQTALRALLQGFRVGQWLLHGDEPASLGDTRGGPRRAQGRELTISHPVGSPRARSAQPLWRRDRSAHVGETLNRRDQN